jgi:hypothetical protein
MCGDHKQIYTPASLVDPSGELVFLTNNIFTSAELTRMTENQQNVGSTTVEAGW